MVSNQNWHPRENVIDLMGCVLLFSPQALAVLCALLQTAKASHILRIRGRLCHRAQLCRENNTHIPASLASTFLKWHSHLIKMAQRACLSRGKSYSGAIEKNRQPLARNQPPSLISSRTEGVTAAA